MPESAQRCQGWNGGGVVSNLTRIAGPFGPTLEVRTRQWFGNGRIYNHTEAKCPGCGLWVQYQPKKQKLGLHGPCKIGGL